MDCFGKILWWNERDCFGVIEDTGGNEVYFDASVIDAPKNHSIKRDQIITFKLNTALGVSDSVCAECVRIPRSREMRSITTKYQRQMESAA